MTLSPQTARLLDMVYSVGAPRFHELSVAQARQSFRKLLHVFRPDAPAVSSVMDVPVSRGDGSVLLCRLYRPLRCARDQRLPCLVYLHGGGWCVGDVESYDVLCRELANLSGCAVFSVDYRLAPEHPFPAAIPDVRIACDWLRCNAPGLALDAARFAVGGDSAGGNLALVHALAMRELGGDMPRHLFLVYPCTEMLSERPSRRVFGEGYLLDGGSLDWFFERYLQGASPTDWRASPMCAHSLAGLPPMSLVTAGYDPLTDDCHAFADRVVAEGGAVARLQVPGVVHGFITLGKLLPEAHDAMRWLGEAVGEALGAGTDAQDAA